MAACSSSEEKEPNGEAPTTNSSIPLDSFLIGNWENMSLEVVINTIDGADSSYTLLVPVGGWEEKLGIKPIKTTYESNNTYRSEYRDVSDSLVQVTRGIWNVFGDTLLLIEPNGTYEYEVRYRDSLAEFHALLDWDGDGAVDDTYRSIQKKQPE